MFQDESVKTILTGSHEAPSTHAATGTPRLNESGSKRPLQSRQSILPHNAAQVAGFPKVKQMPLTYIMPNADRPASQRLAVEFISTASSSTVSGLLTLFPKCFSSFLHSTCSLSVSHIYLVLEEVYLPLRAAIPNNPTLRRPAR